MKCYIRRTTMFPMFPRHTVFTPRYFELRFTLRYADVHDKESRQNTRRGEYTAFEKNGNSNQWRNFRATNTRTRTYEHVTSCATLYICLSLSLSLSFSFSATIDLQVYDYKECHLVIEHYDNTSTSWHGVNAQDTRDVILVEA